MLPGLSGGWKRTATTGKLSGIRMCSQVYSNFFREHNPWLAPIARAKHSALSSPMDCSGGFEVQPT